MQATTFLIYLFFAINGAVQTSDVCRRGADALAQRDLSSAETSLKQCLKTHPNLMAPYVQLCAVYQLQGKTNELHAVALEGLKRFPREKRFYLTVGNQAGRERRFDRAVEVFREAHRRWPDDARFRDGLAEAYLSRGMASLDQGRNEAAKNDLRKAVELQPDNAEALLNLGRAQHNLNQTVDALATFDRLARISPGTPLLHFHRGLILHALAEYDAAITEFTEEIRRNPEHPLSYYFRGAARIVQADWEQALTDLNIAVEKMPDNADAFYSQGRCLLHLAKVSDAERAFQKSLQLNPSDTKALYALGRLLLESGRREESEVLFRKAMALNAENRSAKSGEIKFKSFHSRKAQ